jgi:hypothetical protein
MHASTVQRCVVALLGLAVSTVCGHAQTVIVNVDLAPGGSGGGTAVTFAAQGALASPGNVWNAVSPSTDGTANGEFGSGGRLDFGGDPFSAGSLLNSTGGVTTISVEVFKGDPDGGFALNPLNGWETRLADNARDLMRDFLVSGYDTNPNAVNITGLSTGSSYVLYLYGAGDHGGVSTKFTIDGVDKFTTGVPETSHNLTEGEDYVVFSGIASNGTIAITYMNNGESGDGNFNGFQLSYTPPVAIPTLSGWGMILLAILIAWIAWRRFQPAVA